jgi:hypothetical protein
MLGISSCLGKNEVVGLGSLFDPRRINASKARLASV